MPLSDIRKRLVSACLRIFESSSVNERGVVSSNSSSER
jgi:hypothetical protein